MDKDIAEHCGGEVGAVEGVSGAEEDQELVEDVLNNKETGQDASVGKETVVLLVRQEPKRQGGGDALKCSNKGHEDRQIPAQEKRVI